MRIFLPLAGAALVATLIIPATAHAQYQNRYLNAAMKLYGDLEFESAVESLKKAEKQTNSVAEDVQIAVYLGLIQFELGDATAAESAFKKALAIDQNAALPKRVSPKALAAFDKARKEMLKARPPTPPDTRPTDLPKKPEDTRLLLAVAPVQPDPALSQPRPEVVADTGARRTLALAVGIPLLAVGSGLAVGGGSYFGLQSKDYSSKMQDPKTWQNDPINHQDVTTYKQRADEAGRNANIMVGVGLAVAVAGAVTLIAILASTPRHVEPSTTVGRESTVP
jgi:tetratricopeptide (TPR) repeat protein